MPSLKITPLPPMSDLTSSASSFAIDPNTIPALEERLVKGSRTANCKFVASHANGS